MQSEINKEKLCRKFVRLQGKHRRPEITSHSNNRVKRKFEINLLEKRFFLEEENRWITLKVTPAGMRTINKKGLKVALADAVKNGIIEKY